MEELGAAWRAPGSVRSCLFSASSSSCSLSIDGRGAQFCPIPTLPYSLVVCLEEESGCVTCRAAMMQHVLGYTLQLRVVS